MNYFQNNMQFLKNNSPDLYRVITNVEVIHTGQTTLLPEIGNAIVKTTHGECYLHSLYDRRQEWKHLLAQTNTDAKLLVLFGLGLGDGLPHISQSFASLEHLIIVEPNAEIFRFFLNEGELSQLFKHFHKVSFLVNQSQQQTQDVLQGLMLGNCYGQVEVVASTSYRTLYKAYFEEVYQTVIGILRSTNVSLTTNKVYSYRWLINAWRNLKQSSIDVDEMLTNISSLPIIIVSAGPSLNKNIHLLSEAKDKAIIIAVGSAMTVLESHGIIPHFRMAIDGNEGNIKIFDKVNTTTCPLIYSETLYHGILPMYRGEKICMVVESNYLSIFIRKLQNQETTLISSGFSVANIAVDFACKWNSPKIVLVGQDLCYTDDRFHASGAWDDKTPFRKVDPHEMTKLKDINKRDVYSDRPLLGMKALFEEITRRYPAIDFINATEGGLPIEGIPNKTLRQVLDEDLTNNLQISERINQLLLNCAKSNPLQVLNTMDEIESELREMFALNNKSIIMLQQATGILEMPEKQHETMQLLEASVECVNKLRELPLFKEVLFFYIEDRLRLTKLDAGYNLSDPVTKSKQLYHSLSRQVVTIKEILELTQALLEEYKGERTLTVDYQ